MEGVKGMGYVLIVALGMVCCLLLSVIREMKRLSVVMKEGRVEKIEPSGSEIFTTDHLVVKADGRLIVLVKSQISHVFVLKGETCIVIKKKKIYTANRLSDIEAQLNQQVFIKVHRSYIVNINQIKEIQPWFNQTLQVTLLSGDVAPVSRSYMKAFKRKLSIN